MKPKMQFAILHPGARMHYAVPAIIARAGMLKRLYTDISARTPLLRAADRLLKPSLRPRAVERLLGRRIPEEIPSSKIRQCTIAALWNGATGRDWFGVPMDRHLMDLVLRDGFGGANMLYTLLVNSDLELAREARERGISVVHEVMLAPDSGLWEIEERQRFPGIEREICAIEVEDGRDRDRQKFALSDMILVPSEHVRTRVLDMGAPSHRVRLVPYGVNESWFDEQPLPVPKRVLFVGTVTLRKGVQYLAEAARLLRKRGVACEVRVVGPCNPALLTRIEFEGLTIVGQVPRTRVKREFLEADVFVLPSVAEGSATVTYEALACGVPVITTPNSGSVVRDGIDGFIVPVRDACALADRIERVVTDRQLRFRLSAGARQRAREYTWDRYAERLLGALGELQ